MSINLYFNKNQIFSTIIVEDGRGITKDSKINHINDYIGDQYIESKKNNDTVYYNDSIQITLNKVKKVELFTDHFKVEGNFYVGLEKNNLDYENHKEANDQYIAYSENKTVKMTYILSNNTITKITLA